MEVRSPGRTLRCVSAEPCYSFGAATDLSGAAHTDAAVLTGDAGVSPADSLEQTAWVCHANTIKAYALPAGETPASPVRLIASCE